MCGFVAVVLSVVTTCAGAGDTEALSERGLKNIEALARLTGYVRHFHPSDEAADVEWFSFVSRALPAAEIAASDVELIVMLRDSFRSIAPSVRIGPQAFVHDGVAVGPRAIAAGDQDAVTSIIGWRHRGFGQHASANQNNIYRSDRVTDVIDHAAAPKKDIPPLGTTARVELVTGIFCDVPTVLCFDGKHTLPRPVDVGDGDAAVEAEVDPLSRSGRLANVILAWNILQHFYPYFDVVDVDWDAVLTASLKRAATDGDAREFLDTMRMMVAELDDGHGNVYRQGLVPSRTLPFDWDWAKHGDDAEYVLTVTHVPDPNIVAVRRGDMVRSIDGSPLDAVVEARRMFISAANDQWLRYRLRQELAMSDAGRAMLDMERLDGTTYTAIVQRIPAGQADYSEPRREMFEQIEPGVYYVDFTRLKDATVFAAHMKELVNARAIIADVRGYPGQPFLTFLYHVATEPIRSANWNVPIFTKPDQQDVKWDTSFWQPHRQEPTLTAAVFFLANGSAISYAESCLAIVEHYELGEIVGEATAGTNGNVNPLQLPGGYGVSWTGMKVTKHDGKQHHGVGVQPTVRVDRTVAGIAAGVDEVLAEALSRARDAIADP